MNQTPHFSIQEGVFLIYSLKRDKERVLAVQSFMLQSAFADKRGEQFSETFQ